MCGDMYCNAVRPYVHAPVCVCVVICGAALCPCTCVCGDMYCNVVRPYVHARVCVVICTAMWCGLMSMHLCVCVW